MRMGMGRTQWEGRVRSEKPGSEQLDGAAFLEPHDGGLGRGQLRQAVLHSAELALTNLGVDLLDLHLVDGLDRGLDVGLAGAGVDLERVTVLLVHRPRALLGHERTLDDFGSLHYAASLPAFWRPS